MINVNNISFSYENLGVLKDVTMQIKEGSVTTMLGANGSGKTTLLNILSKNLKVQKGEVFFNDEEIRSISLIW